MKRLLAACFLALAMVCLSSEAQAKRGFGFGGHGQQLIHVADLDMDLPEGGKASLCILADRVHIFFLNLYRSVDSYVLGADRCDSDSFRRLPDGAFTAMQLAGAIPQDLPMKPRLSWGQMLTSYLGSMLLLPFLLIGLMAKLGSRPAREDAPPSAETHADPVQARIDDMVEAKHSPVAPMPRHSGPMPRPGQAPVFGRRRQ